MISSITNNLGMHNVQCTALYIDLMVIMWDGNSETGAHGLNDLGYLNCLTLVMMGGK